MEETAYFRSLSLSKQKKFRPLAEAYAKAYADSIGCKDERLLCLPHHQRIGQNNAISLEARFLEEFAPEVITEVRKPNCTRRDVAELMLGKYPDLAIRVYQGRFDVLCDVALRLMVHYGRIRFFQTTDALESMLQESDFGPDIPVSWFRPPFRDVYIEFGQQRGFPAILRDPVSGEHIIEGAYLLSGMAKPIMGGQLVRGFELVIYGSPSGKGGVMDDCFCHLGIPIEDEEASISDTVNRVVSYHAARSQFLNASAFRPVIEHIAKILIYLGTKEARQREIFDGRDAATKIAGMKSSSKKQKAIRQAARLYDRIVVGPDGLPASFGAGAQRASNIRPHIRRGHFRAQAYGPGYSMRRPQWIQPTLVCKDRFTGEIRLPGYVVR